MLIVLVVAQFLEDLLGLLVSDLAELDSFLLDLPPNVLKHLIRNLCSLLGLELGENLAEMVDTLIGIAAYFLGWFFVRRLLILNQIANAFRAVVAHHNALMLDRNELSFVARFADIRRHNIV